MRRKEGVGRERTPFLNFFYARHRPPHPRLSLYTPPVTPAHSSAPGRLANHRQQGRPRKARHTPGRWTRCTGLPKQAAPGRSYQRRTLEAAQRVRNCADLDAQTAQQNRPKNYHFFVYVCCLCNFTNTQKSVIIMSAKAYTKKCKSHITKHQNRRTKP